MFGITRRQVAAVLGGKHQASKPSGLRHAWYWFIVLFSIECLVFGHLLPDDGDYPVCTLCGAGGQGILNFPYLREVRHYPVS